MNGRMSDRDNLSSPESGLGHVSNDSVSNRASGLDFLDDDSSGDELVDPFARPSACNDNLANDRRRPPVDNGSRTVAGTADGAGAGAGANRGNVVVEAVAVVPVVDPAAAPPLLIPGAAAADPAAAPVAAPGAVPAVDWDTVAIHYSQFMEGVNGKAIGVHGHTFASVNVNVLRKICSRLQIKGSANMRRAVIICKLEDNFDVWKRNERATAQNSGQNPRNGGGNGSGGNGDLTVVSAPQKTVNCGLRLLNILFCNDIFGDYCMLGDSPSRNIQDRGLAANDRGFWEKVREEYTEDYPEHAEMKFPENDHLRSRTNLNPGVIRMHSWKKLSDIYWKSRSDYNIAVDKAQRSGEHGQDFFDFCEGKLETLYFYLWLQVKPDAKGMVAAQLPPMGGRDFDDEDSDDGNISAPRKKTKKTSTVDLVEEMVDDRRRGRGEVSAAIRDLASSKKAMLQIQIEKRAEAKDLILWQKYKSISDKIEKLEDKLEGASTLRKTKIQDEINKLETLKENIWNSIKPNVIE